MNEKIRLDCHATTERRLAMTDFLTFLHFTVFSRIDRHAASQHHVKMEILSPTLERGGSGGI